MRMPWHNRTGLAKAAAIFATILLVALGLCGLNGALMAISHGLKNLLAIIGVVETFFIFASLFGLFVIGLIAGIRSLLHKPKNPGESA